MTRRDRRTTHRAGTATSHGERAGERTIVVTEHPLALECTAQRAAREIVPACGEHEPLGAPPRDEHVEPSEPVVGLGAVEVVVVEPAGIGTPRLTRHERVSAAEQSAALEHRVDELRRDPELVDHERGHALGDRLEHGGRAHRHECGRECEVLGHRPVLDDEVRRQRATELGAHRGIREQLRVVEGLGVGLRLAGAGAHLDDDPAVRAAARGIREPAQQAHAIVALGGHLRLRGEDEVGAVGIEAGCLGPQRRLAGHRMLHGRCAEERQGREPERHRVDAEELRVRAELAHLATAVQHDEVDLLAVDDGLRLGRDREAREAAHEHRPGRALRDHGRDDAHERTAEREEHRVGPAIGDEPPEFVELDRARVIRSESRARERDPQLARARRRGVREHDELGGPRLRQLRRERGAPLHVRVGVGDDEERAVSRGDPAQLRPRRLLAREHALHAVAERFADDRGCRAPGARSPAARATRPGRCPTSRGRA